MSTNITVPSAERRIEVTCYNVGTNGAVKNGDAVLLRPTAGTNPLQPAINIAGATAGTVTKAGGVALAAAATGATCPVVILGPAKVTSNATFATVGLHVALAIGTAGVRGRVTPLSATATAGTIRTRYLGYNLTTTTGAGQEMLIMVNPSPLRQA